MGLLQKAVHRTHPLAASHRLQAGRRSSPLCLLATCPHTEAVVPVAAQPYCCQLRGPLQGPVPHLMEAATACLEGLMSPTKISSSRSGQCRSSESGSLGWKKFSRRLQGQGGAHTAR